MRLLLLIKFWNFQLLHLNFSSLIDSFEQETYLGLYQSIWWREIFVKILMVNYFDKKTRTQIFDTVLNTLLTVQNKGTKRKTKNVVPSRQNVRKKGNSNTSAPVNVAKFLRTPILKNIYERLLQCFANILT